MTTQSELDRGYKVTVSWSVPTGMLHAIDQFGLEHNLRGYTRIMRLLVKYGLIYDRVLYEQSLQARKKKEEAKSKRSVAKKKAKPKTPSKRAKK